MLYFFSYYLDENSLRVRLLLLYFQDSGVRRPLEKSLLRYQQSKTRESTALPMGAVILVVYIGIVFIFIYYSERNHG